LHDIAYVAEKGPKWQEAFVREELKFSVGSQNDWRSLICEPDNVERVTRMAAAFVEVVGETVRDAKGHPMDSGYSFTAWHNKQLVVHHGHAALGSLLLLKESTAWTELGPNEVDRCALAVALHHYSKGADVRDPDEGKWAPPRLGKLTADCLPLAYLLSCCDATQVWGRPVRNTNGPDYFKYVRCDRKPVDSTERLVTVALDFDTQSADKELKEPSASYWKAFGSKVQEETAKMRASWGRSLANGPAFRVQCEATPNPTGLDPIDKYCCTDTPSPSSSGAPAGLEASEHGGP